MKKKNWITFVIILVIIFLSVLILSLKQHPKTTKEITECIASQSALYTQLGCSACKKQENLFGENYQYLNVIDCFYEQEECIEKQIKYTPTWIVNNKEYIGVQSIEKLQELTNC